MYKKSGTTKQEVNWQCQTGFTAKRNTTWYTTCSRVCQRQEAVEGIRRCSPIVGNLWVKTDGSKDRRNWPSTSYTRVSDKEITSLLSTVQLCCHELCQTRWDIELLSHICDLATPVYEIRGRSHLRSATLGHFDVPTPENPNTAWIKGVLGCWSCSMKVFLRTSDHWNRLTVLNDNWRFTCSDSHILNPYCRPSLNVLST